MHPPPFVILGLLPFHVGLCIFLVHHTYLGAAGAAIAGAMTFWAAGGLLVVYVAMTSARECWGDGWDRKAWTGWWQVLKLAIPGAIVSSKAG
jgi:Na+-driven multidrug efflux pump